MHVLILILAIYFIIGLVIASLIRMISNWSISRRDEEYVADKLRESIQTPEDDAKITGDFSELGTMYDPRTSVGYLSICIMWPRVVYIYCRLIKRVFAQSGIDQWPD